VFREMSQNGTNGAPASVSNNGGNNSNNGGGQKPFTTPVKARASRSKAAASLGSQTSSGGQGSGSGSSSASGGSGEAQQVSSGGQQGSGSGSSSASGGSGEAQQVSSGGQRVAQFVADPDPAATLDLVEINFARTGTKPLVKPTETIKGAFWDGAGPRGAVSTRHEVSLAAMQFWKRLAQVVEDVDWTDKYAWLYVTAHGLGGQLRTRVVNECRNMEQLREWLQQEYLRDVTVAELTAPIYQLKQMAQTSSQYFQQGYDMWLLVSDLIPTQERATVATWVGGLDESWARNNQAVYRELRNASTWMGVREVLAENKLSLNEPTIRPRSKEGGRAQASKVGSGEKPKRTEDQDDRGVLVCWSCNEAGHKKRDCPKREPQGNEKGGL
jgi:hypothetical protein